jgi:predicted secreted protein
MAIIGAGAQLQLFSGSYTAVAGVRAIKGPDGQWHPIDVTVLASPSRSKVFLSGFYDGQTVELDIVYDHIQFATLQTQGGVANVWRIVFSDNSKWDFSGFITALATDNPLEDEVTSPMSIKVSGPVTFTS